jgi:hypothetical protein
MIDRVTSCRLLEYIRFIATAPVLWHYVAPFYHWRLAYDQFYVSAILQTLLEAACLQVTLLYTSKEPIIVRRYSLLATILNLKNNLIPILNPQRQLILGEFNLLALTPKEGDTNNILSFINYITINKQAEGLLPIKIKI